MTDKHSTVYEAIMGLLRDLKWDERYAVLEAIRDNDEFCAGCGMDRPGRGPCNCCRDC